MSFWDKILQCLFKPVLWIILTVIYITYIFDLLIDEITGEGRRERREEKRRTRYSLKRGGVRLGRLPFEVSFSEAIYMEDTYHEQTNRFILENIDTARKSFAKHNMTFVYLPLLEQEIRDRRETLRYYSPANDHISDVAPIPLKSNFLLDFMFCPENRHVMDVAAIVKFNTEHSNTPDFNVFNVYEFDVSEAKDIEDYFDFLAERVSDRNGPCFGLYMTHQPVYKNSDDGFDKETMKLLKFVERKIEELRGRGISDVVLERLLKPKQKLSRIVIKKDFRIFLPDYDDMEIRMEPLVKAVFLLFLRHHEGIRFKELPDYRAELTGIYDMIMGRKPMKDSGEMEYSRSIINVTDPLNNSINEKCTRIKEAFLMKFHLSLAENYFVTGKRGEPKSIKLPEELIIWEE